jgi:3-phytase
VVSKQAHDSFVVYRREGSNGYVGTFAVVDGNGIDGVTHTDGIAVQSGDLGPRFPRGVFVAQDHENDRGNQNFKLVPWHAIEEALARAGRGALPSSARAASR